MRAVEAAHKAGRGEPAAHHVDAQRAVAQAYGGHGLFRGLQQVTGVGQESLALGGEPRAARSPGEQPHSQFLLQRGDALGDGLLGDRQVHGCFLELACGRYRDEGAHRSEIHANRP